MKETILPHQRLKASMQRYGCRYDELNANARRQVDADVTRAMTLEDAVLHSPEGRHVSIDEAVLDAAFREVRLRYGSGNEFRADLRLNGLTPDVLRTALRRELEVEAALEKVAAATPGATETDLQTWYDTHPAQFAMPETRDARHVLVTINADFAENRREAALQRITELQRSLDGSLAAFESVARRHSECPSAMDGGRLGTVRRGMLYSELDMALFRLPEGGTSEVLASEIGFHIVLCEKVHPGRTVSFDEAREKIRTALDARRREQTKACWLAALTGIRHAEAV